MDSFGFEPGIQNIVQSSYMLTLLDVLWVFKNATEMFNVFTKAVPHAFYALVYAVSNMYLFQKVGPFQNPTFFKVLDLKVNIELNSQESSFIWMAIHLH